MTSLNKNKNMFNKKDEDRIYKSEWEKIPEYKDWLTKCPKNKRTKFDCDQAYCTWCLMPLRCHKNGLHRHMETIRHKSMALTRKSKSQKTLASCGISKENNESKTVDIKLVLHAAVHGTIRSIDHLSETLMQCGKGSSLEKLRLHRTKASKLIQNVIAPSFLHELIQDIGEQHYSIILDESTDVSTQKFMAYCVRYFSITHNKIMTNFLGFSPVTLTTSIELYNIFKSFLKSVGLQLDNLIAIGTDGASNLCGKNNSLFTLLKTDVPSLQLIKCTCHSIDKCADYATEELPSNLLFLLRETNNWFAHSALRLSMYEEYYKKMNNGKKPLKLLSLSTTRWLVVYQANLIILKQWQELKGFFIMVIESTNFKKCYSARLLAEMYKDENNYLYLVFLDSALKDLYSLNLSFQKENNDITKLYSDLRILLLSTARRVFKPSALKLIDPLHFSDDSTEMLHQADLDGVRRAVQKSNDEFGNSMLPVDSIDFGYNFDEAIEKHKISTSNAKVVKERAANFLVRLCKELEERLPQNVGVFEKLKYFSPQVCISTVRIPIKNLPWDLAAKNCTKENIESQLRLLQSMRMQEILPEYDSSKYLDISDFWIAVWQQKNYNGERTFKDLAEFALRALSLPISNAGVERVFSVMAAVKTKIRNRMQMSMLVALIRIRMHLKVHKICCKNFAPTDDMFHRFNQTMYDNLLTDDRETHDHASDFELLEAFEMFDEVVQSTSTKENEHEQY